MFVPLDINPFDHYHPPPPAPQPMKGFTTPPRSTPPTLYEQSQLHAQCSVKFCFAIKEIIYFNVTYTLAQ